MANIKSIGRKPSIRKRNVINISRMKISPAQKIKYHRREATRSLKENNYPAYRFHSLQVAKINSGLIISKMKKKG